MNPMNLDREKIVGIVVLGVAALLVAWLISGFIEAIVARNNAWKTWKRSCGWSETEDLEFIKKHFEEWIICIQMKLVLLQVW